MGRSICFSRPPAPVGADLKDIPCPTLVGAGGGNEARAREYIEAVSGPRVLYRITVDQRADTHNQLNNLSSSNHVVSYSLDELFDRSKGRRSPRPAAASLTKKS